MLEDKADEVIEDDAESAEDIEDIVEDAAEEKTKEEIEARRRSAKMQRARRMARMRRKALEVDELSEDLIGPEGDSSDIESLHDGEEHVSDDLETPNMKSDEVAQEPPASASEAEEKVAAAYALVDAQIAAGKIPATTRKAAVARKYAKQYTTREMRLMAQSIKGTSGKAKGVRISRRSAMRQASANKGVDNSMTAECLFA